MTVIAGTSIKPNSLIKIHSFLFGCCCHNSRENVMTLENESRA